MKLSSCYLYFLACSCLATTCGKTEFKPKIEHNQLNQKKDSDKEDLNINEIDDGNLPPLYKSVHFGDLKEVRRLLELGIDPNVIYKGNYPIEVAVRKRNKAMVSFYYSFMELKSSFKKMEGQRFWTMCDMKKMMYPERYMIS